MFWIIGEKDEPTMAKATEKELERLAGNGALAGQLVRQVYQYSPEQIDSVLTPPVGGGEPIYVLAHAGYENRPNVGKEPWIAGLWFDQFTATMATKFTAAGLSGRILWFFVCEVGKDVAGFAAKLSALGVRNTTIYMPKDFVYTSTTGIPHVLTGQKNGDAATKLVAHYNCVYMDLTDSLTTGSGWAGARIDGGGAVTPIGGQTVENAVKAHFDPDELES